MPIVHDCRIDCLSPTEQVSESLHYLRHYLEHSLAGGSLLLELEHLKSQKSVLIIVWLVRNMRLEMLMRLRRMVRFVSIKCAMFTHLQAPCVRVTVWVCKQVNCQVLMENFTGYELRYISLILNLNVSVQTERTLGYKIFYLSHVTHSWPN